jgi:hypothetical protein
MSRDGCNGAASSLLRWEYSWVRSLKRPSLRLQSPGAQALNSLATKAGLAPRPRVNLKVRGASLPPSRTLSKLPASTSRRFRSDAQARAQVIYRGAPASATMGRPARRSKKSAWLMVARTVSAWKGFVMRNAGSGFSPVSKRSG